MIIDIRTIFIKISGKLLTHKQMAKEIDLSVKSMKISADLSTEDLFDIARKLGWIYDAPDGKLVVKLG